MFGVVTFVPCCRSIIVSRSVFDPGVLFQIVLNPEYRVICFKELFGLFHAFDRPLLIEVEAGHPFVYPVVGIVNQVPREENISGLGKTYVQGLVARGMT